jgi:hypothetical protein
LHQGRRGAFLCFHHHRSWEWSQNIFLAYSFAWGDEAQRHRTPLLGRIGRSLIPFIWMLGWVGWTCKPLSL